MALKHRQDIYINLQWIYYLNVKLTVSVLSLESNQGCVFMRLSTKHRTDNPRKYYKKRKKKKYGTWRKRSKAIMICKFHDCIYIYIQRKIE